LFFLILKSNELLYFNSTTVLSIFDILMQTNQDLSRYTFMLRITALLIGILAFSISSYAQSSDLGNWAIYFGNKKFNDKWNLHHEVQYRNYNVVGDLEQLLLRTGVGYNLAENNANLLLGYGFIRSENYASDDSKFIVNEHRIYQQLQFKQSFGRFSFGHRYRMEERFIDNGFIESFKMRFRYFLTAKVALSQPTMVAKTFYLSAYNEIFLNIGDAPFDRDRLYGGLGYKATDNLSFELGYMNQVFAAGSRDQVNIIASFSF